MFAPTGCFVSRSFSLAADHSVFREFDGVVSPANIWFPKPHAGTQLREMKVAEQYGTLSLLVLPSTADVSGPWEPRAQSLLTPPTRDSGSHLSRQGPRKC